MPDETKKFGTKITTAGAALIAECILSGDMLKITEAAAGDGGGAYYEPTIEQTALINEQWRGRIASAEISPLTPNMIDVKIVIGDEVGGFTVREMGLFDESGTLIAVCNTPDTEKVTLTGGVSGKLTMVMHIIVADVSVVEFTINPALNSVSEEDLAEAIARHNGDNTSHYDIRQLALGSMQQGDAYTKPETDELVAATLAEHNTSETAHPHFIIDLAALDGRLKTLELKYGADVSGNSFEVTFVNLTGLVVTGVWNEELARIEF